MTSHASGVGIRCVGLSHVYRTSHSCVTALRGVDLEVPPGGSLAVLGPSGSGKSTLLTLLAALHRPTSGELWVGEQDLSRLTERGLGALRRTQIATVVQSPGRNLLPYGNAEDNIRFAQRPASRAVRRTLPQPADLLGRLGLSDLAGRQAAGLSGGEQQRLSVAVGLARSPAVLLLDEPTSQLDARSRDRVIALLARIIGEVGSTVVAVTHDLAVTEALQRTVTLADGAITDPAGTSDDGG